MITNTTYRNPAAVRDDSAELDATLDFTRQLAAKKFFVIVQLSFQSGHLTNIRRDESMKPDAIQNLIATSKGSTNGRKTQ